MKGNTAEDENVDHAADIASEQKEKQNKKKME